MMDDSDPRSADRAAFLEQAGWGDAALIPLGQDASTRRYFRVRQSGETRLLMDAPPETIPCPPGASEDTRARLGWNAMTRLAAGRVDAFAEIAAHLRGLGLSAPDVLASDAATGFAIIEDFGDQREFARQIEQGADEIALYTLAADVLAHLHAQPVPTQLGNWPILEFDPFALQSNVDLFFDYLPLYDPRMRADNASRKAWQAARDALIARATGLPRSFTLRDFHAENLLWLPEREGLARVGLLDFQDAVIGWDVWDIAMLVQDARRPVSDAARKTALSRYLDLTGKAEADLLERLAIIGTLNALRIVGVFTRLVSHFDRPGYERFIPRQQYLLAQNLAHPSVADMAAYVREVAPFIFEVQP